MRKIFLSAFLLLFTCLSWSPAFSASIEFSVDDLLTSQDLAEAMQSVTRAIPLDQTKYKALSANFLFQDMPLRKTDGKSYRMMLTGGEITERGHVRNIQLLIVDDERDVAKVIQRHKLGDGEAPQMLPASSADDAQDLMVRVIRTGNNSEAYVYEINRASGKLKDTMRINRSFVERYKLSIKGTMQAQGRVDILSRTPPHEEQVDLVESLDALIEDEIYQPNGRPISSLVNLKCVRNGWEDEDIRTDREGAALTVGLSLMTISNKQVLDVNVVFRKNSEGAWRPNAIQIEPFLPYRW